MLRNNGLLIAFTLALLLIFTGSALAASDRRPPTADRRLSLILPASSLSSIFYPLSSTLTPSSFIPHPSSFLPPSTVYRLPSTDGAKLFKQWCSTCHGDKGQGLTPEWRAEWPEDKQNCWQSKCHAGNHPPDGFSFPKKVPALIGLDTLTKFSTAQDLYAYSRAAMPYWSPNLLKDHEYQAITTFLVEANYAARGAPLPISLADDLTAVPLHPQFQSINQFPPGTTAPYSLLPTPYFLFPCLASGCPPRP
ncbi:MAG: cytochrome c [Anaerolineae bacterium]|nr:cytochrome c [Anaerolineae bacterium]